MTSQPTSWALQIVEADHDENVFRTLGGAAWQTEAQQRAQYDAIPGAPAAADDAPQSWVVDVLDAGGAIVGGKEIDEETARTLLGATDLQPLREIADEREREGRAQAAAFIARRQAEEQ